MWQRSCSLTAANRGRLARFAAARKAKVSPIPGSTEPPQGGEARPVMQQNDESVPDVRAATDRDAPGDAVGRPIRSANAVTTSMLSRMKMFGQRVGSNGALGLWAWLICLLLH